MLRNGLEPWHLIVVALVVIVLFGSKKLPEAARGLGKSMRILKSEARALKNDDAAASATVHAVPGESVTVQEAAAASATAAPKTQPATPASATAAPTTPPATPTAQD